MKECAEGQAGGVKRGGWAVHVGHGVPAGTAPTLSLAPGPPEPHVALAMLVVCKLRLRLVLQCSRLAVGAGGQQATAVERCCESLQLKPLQFCQPPNRHVVCGLLPSLPEQACCGTVSPPPPRRRQVGRLLTVPWLPLGRWQPATPGTPATSRCQQLMPARAPGCWPAEVWGGETRRGRGGGSGDKLPVQVVLERQGKASECPHYLRVLADSGRKDPPPAQRGEGALCSPGCCRCIIPQ